METIEVARNRIRVVTRFGRVGRPGALAVALTSCGKFLEDFI
jgi:hypothetical protein